MGLLYLEVNLPKKNSRGKCNLMKSIPYPSNLELPTSFFIHAGLFLLDPNNLSILNLPFIFLQVLVSSNFRSNFSGIRMQRDYGGFV